MIRIRHLLSVVVFVVAIGYIFASHQPVHAADLIVNAECDGIALRVTITSADQDILIEGVGHGLPTSGNIGLYMTSVDGGTNVWTGVRVTELGGDAQTVYLGDFDCTTPLNVYAECVDGDLHIVRISGDTRLDITGTGPQLPYISDYYATVIVLSGPAIWTGVSVTERTGDRETSYLGNWNCFTPLSANVACVGFEFHITIMSADQDVLIDGVGPSLPRTGNIGFLSIPSPGTWLDVTVTELGGDNQTLYLGSFDCPSGIPLVADVVCDDGDLRFNITSGDAPFTITGMTSDGIPVFRIETITGSTAAAYPTRQWTGITITEGTGSQSVVNFGDFNCTSPLDVSGACVGDDLVVTFTSADEMVVIDGTGPGLSRYFSEAPPSTVFFGPASWTGVTVTENTGDNETVSLGDFNCSTPLIATAVCINGDLEVTITAGDVPFRITGTGAGFPMNSVGLGTYTFTDTWADVVVTEIGGDAETIAFGTVGCGESLIIGLPICFGDDMRFMINGDAPFTVTGTGPGLPLTGLVDGVQLVAGPGVWTNMTITEQGGDGESFALGDFSCVEQLIHSFPLCLGDTLRFSIDQGDAPYNVTGTGVGLPLLGISEGIHTIVGPETWTNVTITETTGDMQSYNLGDFSCLTPTIPIVASAVCMGDDLQVTITAGDGLFSITGTGAGLPIEDVGTGIYTLTGPATWSNIIIYEGSGNFERPNLGNFACPLPNIPLNASAVCVGDDLQISITAGDALFSITGTGAGLPMTNIGLGTITLTGAGTWTGVTVTELSGDTESALLGDFTCPTTVTPPPVTPPPPVIPAPVVLSPDLTALGCVVTADVDIFNAPNNTYCRVLMQNGVVVNYSGAVPANLIALGVILAVDVYRLDGGQSINTFPNYARICLMGEGRLFYMDGRNAPRVSIELASSVVDGMTCGWIPAPGTLILTN
jgi:hypothetical protein